MDSSMEMILVAGLLPCVVLLFYIYRKDTVEKEPVGLLIKLLLLGCLSTIPAIILEMIGSYILSAIGLTEGSTLYYLIENFLIIAVAEEASKRYMLRKGSWNDPAFNYVFEDGNDFMKISFWLDGEIAVRQADRIVSTLRRTDR